MAKLLVNELDLYDLINSYCSENSSFRVIDKTKTAKKWNYKFIIDGKNCSLDAYILKDGIRFVSTGKNVDKCNELISYLQSKCIDADVETKTITINSRKENIKKVINEIENDEIASIEKKENSIKLKGYYGDIVNLNVYESKTVIQAKPLRVFGTLISYLGKYIDIDDLCLNDNSQSTLSHGELLDAKIRQRIGDCYNYLDISLKNSLKSTYELINVYETNSIKLADYSGILVGAFKALEGYLRKVLMYGYEYRCDKGKRFEMFNQKSDNFIDNNTNISDIEKIHLKKLYNIFNQKRNVYLHGSATNTVIIKNFFDAKSIFDEILDELAKSYSILNK